MARVKGMDFELTAEKRSINKVEEVESLYLLPLFGRED